MQAMDYLTDISTNSTVTSLTELTSASENLTCEETRNNFLSRLSPQVWLLALFCVYFIFGVFGNGILVLLFLTKKNLRTINNALVTNLAFSDFLFVILFAPIKYFEEAYGMRPLGKSFCYISIVINYTSQDVSVMSMTALSYLRYRVVMRPLRMRRDDRKLKRFVSIVCGISWVVGAAAAVFPASYCEEASDKCLLWDRHIIQSFDDDKTHLIFHIVRFVFFYLLPLLVIAYFYSVMALKLCRKPSALRTNDSISTRKATRSRKKLGGIILVIVVIFFLSWLPNYLVWFTGLDDGKFHSWLLLMRSVCMFLPACSNTVILLMTGTDYRKPFLNTFSLWRQSGRSLLQRLRSSVTTTNLSSVRLSRLGRDTGQPPCNDHSPKYMKCAFKTTKS